ncbi:phosphate ABC transporter substrate-binding protein [Methanotrichaceae archaeon M04Ac]|uniref:Phosphate ABC transporter substrate-binding protein n=1 Tax=Candidatus Methanocrinis alkalitolerans TaxID=3033395 RepID=A0ABT5XDX0_9EURY|nr:phosphate ABC transporter substrate-binding protein [Candidatus Methanocrinis alkalitolerans]MCR3883573.1 phosphate ABC transporter substrate-binding protein [Methanothrix sp.]MDF0592877.1 phosphate ABC transporter substrate-binding protein [Candidatus Methanocrinis alkalitolerans]
MARPESVMTWIVVAIFVAAGAVLYIIGGEELELRDSSRGAASNLSVAGSTTVQPFAEACAQEFNLGQKDVVVNVAGIGTDSGLRRLAAGTADISMTSRKVGDSEIGSLGGRLAEHQIARDAVSIVVSSSIREAGIEDLSQDQLRAIYTGEIKSWRELGGPDREITAVSRSPGSGTGEIFSERVATPGVSVYRDSSFEVEEFVAGSDRAIGYLGLNLAREEGLATIAYEGVLPSAKTIGDGSYPLARTLYMYTWGEPDDDERAFLEFVTGERGQAIAGEMGFVPLST